MNKIIIIVVFIFWSAVSIFYANSLFRPDKVTINNLQNNQQVLNTDNIQPSTFALELANHNSKENCWLAIAGKVYDVTKYIYAHPGGSGEIIKYCGQDGTRAFASKDKSNPKDHSAQAYAMLAPYYIGDLNSVSAVNTNTQNTNINNNTNTNQNNPVNLPTNINNPTPTNLILTAALVAQHNTTADCWVTAGNNVYNVTSYIRSHPGGQGNITKYCGADLATAYTAQGHSVNAGNIFASYKIGTIGSSVSTDIVNTPPVNTNQNPFGTDDDDEDDD
jgi:cytochrome b involved in lipid metabolism